MDGPSHYQAAENLLDMASDDEMGSDAESYHQRQAQVHATLALAAATALGRFADLPIHDSDAWLAACKTPEVTP